MGELDKESSGSAVPGADPADWGGRGTVAVVGAGNTGASWAGLFAAHGYGVRLFDTEPGALEPALGRALAAARFLVDKGLARPEPARLGMANLRSSLRLDDAVTGVVLIQECVREDLALKREVFAEISRVAPEEALIASSSSGLSITEIQKNSYLPGRTLAAHPYNPPHLIPLVELAPGALTTGRTLDQARDFYLRVGMEPVSLSRDIPGYIANRLSAALWREAIELVRAGVATVEEVDTAVRYGPGLRWAVMGPHLIYHLGGGTAGLRGHMSHLASSKEGMLRDLATWTTFPADAVDLLADGVEAEVGGRTIAELEAERDEALASVLLALREDRLL